MTTTPPRIPKDAPAVVIQPPVLFALTLILALGLNYLWPLWLARDASVPSTLANLVLYVVGWCVLVLGCVYLGAAVLQFLVARTAIPTFRPATVLVTRGVYNITRNPMYVGVIEILAGLALVLANGWLLILLAPMIAVLRWGVIDREEAYLEAKFGPAYLDYRLRVRRRF